MDFILIPAPDERQDEHYIREMTAQVLNEVAKGKARLLGSDRYNDHLIPPGAFTLTFPHIAPVIGQVGTPLATALMGWITARSKRQVSLKVDGVEVRANSPKQVKELLEHAQAFKQANEPKRIHER